MRVEMVSMFLFLLRLRHWLYNDYPYNDKIESLFLL